MGDQQRSSEKENVQRLSRRGVGESRSGRHLERDDDIVWFARNGRCWKAIVDSGGSEYNGTVYKKGTTKTVYAYLPVGETVYKAGTPVTKIGSPHSSHVRYKGNGSSGYLRGSSVTRYSISSTYRNAYTYDSSRERYESIGTVYKVSSGTYYRGDGDYVVGRGDPVNAIDFHGTLYENGGSVTPIGSPVYNAYQRNAEDDETFSAIGSACSLKLANFSTRNVTALTT